MIRVFPRRTKWTPTDNLAFVGDPPLWRPAEQPVKISVTFTWDIEEGKRLYRAWSDYYQDVEIGGPAYGDQGGEFNPGLFIKEGVTITSRGCPNKCPFCFVPQREGNIRELEIKQGWIIQDNKFLSCSREHIERVFDMLRRQNKTAEFNGGLEAKRLRDWHIPLFDSIKIKHLWFACDSAGQEKYIKYAAELFSHYPEYKKRCYVLIGFNGESVMDAEKRLNRVYKMGFLPFAQLYQTEKKRQWTKEWDALQREYCRPAIYKTKMAAL